MNSDNDNLSNFGKYAFRKFYNWKQLKYIYKRDEITNKGTLLQFHKNNTLY